jgi:hypothetical protein
MHLKGKGCHGMRIFFAAGKVIDTSENIIPQ